MRPPRYGGMQHALLCGMRLPFGVGRTSAVAPCCVGLRLKWYGTCSRRAPCCAEVVWWRHVVSTLWLAGAVGLGATTVSSWWIFFRCPWPELFAGAGS